MRFVDFFACGADKAQGLPALHAVQIEASLMPDDVCFLLYLQSR